MPGAGVPDSNRGAASGPQLQDTERPGRLAACSEPECRYLDCRACGWRWPWLPFRLPGPLGGDGAPRLEIGPRTCEAFAVGAKLILVDHGKEWLGAMRFDSVADSLLVIGHRNAGVRHGSWRCFLHESLDPVTFSVEMKWLSGDNRPLD